MRKYTYSHITLSSAEGLPFWQATFNVITKKSATDLNLIGGAFYFLLKIN
jgi:hypothetical protein